MVLLLLFVVLGSMLLVSCEGSVVDPAESQIWGPGLYPDQIVMPARYFYIQALDRHKHK
jgi:hypothetical protein